MRNVGASQHDQPSPQTSGLPGRGRTSYGVYIPRVVFAADCLKALDRIKHDRGLQRPVGYKLTTTGHDHCSNLVITEVSGSPIVIEGAVDLGPGLNGQYLIFLHVDPVRQDVDLVACPRRGARQDVHAVEGIKGRLTRNHINVRRWNQGLCAKRKRPGRIWRCCRKVRSVITTTINIIISVPGVRTREGPIAGIKISSICQDPIIPVSPSINGIPSRAGPVSVNVSEDIYNGFTARELP